MWVYGLTDRALLEIEDMVINQFKINKHIIGQCFKKMRDFPSSPVVKTLPFQFRRWVWVWSLVGKLRFPFQCGQKKKLRCPVFQITSVYQLPVSFIFKTSLPRLSREVLWGREQELDLRHHGRPRGRPARGAGSHHCSAAPGENALFILRVAKGTSQSLHAPPRASSAFESFTLNLLESFWITNSDKCLISLRDISYMTLMVSGP